MIKIDIHKQLFGSNGTIDLNVDFQIDEGEFIALSGDSGSGKTTLLRILAGLENGVGEISFLDDVWLSKNFTKSPQKREIGFVFQDYALFDNMSVKENLLYVNQDLDLAKYLLKVTDLFELQNRMPKTLSGGQKQRVSLCRAFMNKPKLLLMDEPLSALDLSMRIKLQNEIIKLHKEFKPTIIMVSHDSSEIYKMCNRIIVLKDGKIIKDGKVKDILLHTQGSSKFSFEGELLDIIKTDVIHVAIISIGQQIVEVVVSLNEARDLQIGQKVHISTKAFAPTISNI
jgi:molybdate transport system ATP-binding protein